MNTTVKTDERSGWTSASSAEADALCPGRHLACKGIAEPETTPDAARGNVVHSFLAGCKAVKLSDEEADLVNRCEEREIQILKLWGDPDNEAYELHREERLWIEFGELKHSGKPDVVWLDAVDGRALILDYKTGRNEVAEPNTNRQLRDLAVLVARNYDVESVTVAIVQPYAKAQPPCAYEHEDLEKAEAELKARVTASNDPKSPRVPGAVQCQYCRAKATCQPFMDASLPKVIGSQTPETIKAGILAMPGDRLGKFLALVRLAEETATNEVRRRLDAGDSVEGWTLKPGREVETVTNPQGVFDRAHALGVSVPSFLAAVKVTKTGLKSALEEATGSKGKALEAEIDFCLAGNIETKTGSSVLTAT